MLDQQPVGSLLAFPLSHPGQDPAAVKFSALKGEVQLAFFIRALGVVAVPIAAIPNHDRAAAVLALRNSAFEVPVIQRMVFDLYRKPLIVRIERGTLGDRPGLENAVQFEPQIIMQVRCRMLLNQRSGGASTSLTFAFPLGSAVFEKSRLARYFASSFLTINGTVIMGILTELKVPAPVKVPTNGGSKWRLVPIGRAP